LIYLGMATYSGAPPLAGFASPSGEMVIPRRQIIHGEKVFHLRGLMSYGSFWGDGAERGPDFTADALDLAKSRRIRNGDCCAGAPLPLSGQQQGAALKGRARLSGQCNAQRFEPRGPGAARRRTGC
jgi:nitric oxide reductase large subunit